MSGVLAAEFVDLSLCLVTRPPSCQHLLCVSCGSLGVVPVVPVQGGSEKSSVFPCQGGSFQVWAHPQAAWPQAAWPVFLAPVGKQP